VSTLSLEFNMLFSLSLSLAAVNAALVVTSTTRPPFSTVEPSLTQILSTEATAVALSPVSNVKGQAFDRVVQIWLENTVRTPNDLK
jgi:acid phosphatase